MQISAHEQKMIELAKKVSTAPERRYWKCWLAPLMVAMGLALLLHDEYDQLRSWAFAIVLVGAMLQGAAAAVYRDRALRLIHKLDLGESSAA